MAVLIAIEGIDGSGKGTQSAMLEQSLRAAGLRVSRIAFPRYEETLFGRAVGRYLDGQFGSLSEVHPWLVSLLFAGDRFESRGLIRECSEKSDVLIFDRYVASNIAHQAAKLAPEDREEFREWIEQVEFEVFEMPRPDRVVLLDISAEAAQSLVLKKQQRSYTDQQQDIQEADSGYLAAVADAYRSLADQPHWRAIACEQDGTIRPPDDIAADLKAAIDDLV